LSALASTHRNTKYELKCCLDHAYTATNAIGHDSNYNSMIQCDTIIADSGASQHMSTGKSRLIIPGSVTATQSSTTIQFGNSTAISKNSCKMKIGELTINALVVPGLQKNLLSISKFCSETDGFAIFFQNHGKLMTKDKVIARLERINGIFQVVEERHTAFISETRKEESGYLWHCRLGHCSARTLSNIIPNLKEADLIFLCTGCTLGKLTRRKHKHIEHNETILEMLQADVIVGLPESIIEGYKHLLIVIDVGTRKIWAICLRRKGEVPGELIKLMKREQRQRNLKILRFYSDGGTEFQNDELQSYFESEGIDFKRTATDESESNGLVEKGNRTIEDKARCLIHTAQLTEKLWPYAVQYAAYIYNRTPHSALKKSPEEAYTNQKPTMEKLLVWGSIAYGKDNNPDNKFSPRGQRGLFMGIDNNGLYQVLLLDLSHFKIVTFRTIEIYELQFLDPADPNARFLKDNNPRSMTNESINTRVTDNKGKGENIILPNSIITDLPNIDQHSADEMKITHGMESSETSAPIQSDDEEFLPSEEGEQVISTTNRPIRAAKLQAIINMSEQHEDIKDFALLGIEREEQADIILSREIRSKNEKNNFTEDEPPNHAIAMEYPHWKEAMNNEMKSLLKNNTWTLVDAPNDTNIVKSKWIFKIKRNELGEITRYKARLVACGYSQKEMIDYYQTFAPVGDKRSLRLLISLVCQENLHWAQFDVDCAFLYAVLKEKIFMKQPPGFEDGINRVCHLLKSIYGLKQASREWYSTLSDFLETQSFSRSNIEPCIFILKNPFTIIFLYVDDLIVCSKDPIGIQILRKQLCNRFSMKDIGDVSYILGMQVIRDSKSISISQSRLTTELIQNFERKQGSLRIQITPSKPGEILTKSEGNQLNMKESDMYRSALGSLLYLACGTRPDIAYATSILSQFASTPKDTHMNALKRLIGYLKGSANYGLVYTTSMKQGIIVHSDSDYAGCSDTSRSRSAAVIYHGEDLISWVLNKHPEIDESTCAAEYIGMHHAAKEAIWINKLLQELTTGCPYQDEDVSPPHLLIDRPTQIPTLRGDNQSALKILNNGTTGPMGMKRHLRVHYRWTEEMVEREKNYSRVHQVFRKFGGQFHKACCSAKIQTNEGILC
jgi:hypothetical protein